MRMPWSCEDEIIELNYNVIDSYNKILNLNAPNFTTEKNKIKIIRTDMRFNDIQQWMREVIWYGHRSGKYLCNVEKIEDNKKIQKKSQNTMSQENIGRHFGPYIV